VVVEEPDLREHQRGRRERDRDRLARRDHQRHEPDEVLGREDLREREEAGYCCRERERETCPGIP
jgi:hypothetical protein